MRKHPEFLLFGMVAAIYITCCTPDITWINVGCDSFYYYSIAIHGVAWGPHPMYAAWGQALTSIPIGTLSWRAAFFMSVLPAIITSIMIFYATRKQTDNKYAPYIGTLTFAGSAVVLSQSTVQEVYSLTTMFCFASYLACVYGRSIIAAVMYGLAFNTHFLSVLFMPIALMFWMPKKKYILLLTPFMAAPFILNNIFGVYNLASYWLMLPGLLMHGELSLLPTRLMGSVAIVVAGYGLALIPALMYLKDITRTIPFWVMIIPALTHLTTSFSPESYVQLVVASPFIATAASLGIEKLKTAHLEKAVLVCGAALLCIMPAFWDIGRTLDRTPTTARLWYDQILSVPDGSVITSSRRYNGIPDTVGTLARSAIVAAKYGYGKELYFMNVDAYIDPTDALHERERLRELGFETPYITGSENRLVACVVNMEAFAEANPDHNVYKTIVVEPEVFGCELVKVK